MSISGIKTGFHNAGHRIKEHFRNPETKEQLKRIGKICLKVLAFFALGLAYLTGALLFELFFVPSLIVIGSATLALALGVGCVKARDVYKKKKAARAQLGYEA